MNQKFAQTNVQLYQQRGEEGYPLAEQQRVYVAYNLAMGLFGGQFRGSGKTFLAHLVGTASILADLQASVDVVVAALLHAAYSDGLFERQSPGVTDQKRALLRESVGAEVEDLVFRYQNLAWRQPGAVTRLRFGLPRATILARRSSTKRSRTRSDPSSRSIWIWPRCTVPTRRQDAAS